jgi:glycosyltransferase involved in cell wall biosynthesis
MSKRIRVLWLIKGLAPGGAERLLVAAAQAHDPARVELHAAYLVPSLNHLADELERSGVEVSCLRMTHEIDLRWVLRLRLMMLHGGFDVIHSHSPYVAGFARLVTKSLPVSTRPIHVSTEHTVRQMLSVPTRLICATTAFLDDAQLAVSTAVRDSTSQRLAPEPQVLHHGIELEEVQRRRINRDEMRRKLNLSSADVVIGTVANYRPEKAYPVLLKAARIVTTHSDQVCFVVVGHGQLEGEIRRLHTELGLGNRVKLLGFREDAVDVMAACDIFCLASDYEGLPVAVMEALALGLPIVATAVGGIVETIADGVHGSLVAPQAPEALANALIALADDPDTRGRMSLAAKQLSTRFDMRRATAEIERTYVMALAARRRSRRRDR